jgi:hypothetical protein
VDDPSAAPWFVTNVLNAVAERGDAASPGLVVIDEDGARAALVEAAVSADRRHDGGELDVASGARTIAPGLAAMSDAGWSQRSFGALAHALAVRADGDPDRLSLHVVTTQHAPFPSSTRQVFDLGPDDDASLHFDVYEERQAPPGDGIAEHRLVLRAHLARERGFDRSVAVTFDLLDTGLLSIGPGRAWSLEWQPGRLTLPELD